MIENERGVNGFIRLWLCFFCHRIRIRSHCQWPWRLKAPLQDILMKIACDWTNKGKSHRLVLLGIFLYQDLCALQKCFSPCGEAPEIRIVDFTRLLIHRFDSRVVHAKMLQNFRSKLEIVILQTISFRSYRYRVMLCCSYGYDMNW